MLKACSAGAAKGRRSPEQKGVATSDPALAAARVWSGMIARIDGMVLEWQRLEHRVSVLARTRCMAFASACESDLPEAKAMRALDARIAAAQRCADRQLKGVLTARPTSLEGMIAKLELALTIVGRFGWQEIVQDLLAEGIADLRDAGAAKYQSPRPPSGPG